jgi:molybdopterin-containing oxidoreductase family iron-sulfur binding subunit
MECPAQCGIQVKAYEKFHNGKSRFLPVKVEGLPGHPVNDGRLCMRGQASITRLYQEDRLQAPQLKDGTKISWEDAYRRIRENLKKSSADGTKKNVWLSGRTSGTLSNVIDLFCQEMNVERHKEFELFSHSEIREANELVFGRAEIPHYRVAEADYLLTIGADVVETFVSPVSFTKGLTELKEHHHGWTHVEPHMSLTGANADHRLVIRPGSEVHLLAGLFHGLKPNLPSELLGLVPNTSVAEVLKQPGMSEETFQKLIEELSHARRPLIITGGVSISAIVLLLPQRREGGEGGRQMPVGSVVLVALSTLACASGAFQCDHVRVGIPFPEYDVPPLRRLHHGAQGVPLQF